MTIEIEISEKNAAALKQQADAAGLTLETLLAGMAERAATELAVRKRYSLDELVGLCDPSSPLTSEDAAWLTDSSRGRETL